MVKHIVYLHGFNSSPLSTKAQQFVAAMAQDYPQVQVYVPHLSTWPAQAMQEVVSMVQELDGDVAFVGSSLGGFYATWLAHKFATKAVLINPAVRPDLLLQDMLGPQSSYHTDDGEYDLTVTHLDQLANLLVDPLTDADKLLVLLQTADETLDYREAANWYAASHLDIEQGGSHAYDNFPQRIPQIMLFVG
ncbi:MAG: YqiA/YcfP family alpha/beta fold hydrolase [Gammaproteobacteria bacterium]|jgi:hypothetical protein|nr:YqiA/YcfP family alpha/beta fold hydrolase [Gammaproteobacteria bacterium]